MHFTKRPLAIVDIETTGLNHKEHEIIEIGLLVVDQVSLKILDELDVKIWPQHIETASEYALELNGYNAQDWIGEAVQLKKAMEMFVKKVGKTELTGVSASMLAAWNDSFEYRFLREAFYKTGCGEIDKVMDYHKRDITTFASEVLRYTSLSGENMKKVTEYLGIKSEPEIHRAIEGAKNAYRIYKYLREITESHFREIAKKLEDGR